MWITARPIAGTCGTSNKSTSGSWLDAAYESCKNEDSLELHIVSLGKVKSLTIFQEGRHFFYLLPKGKGTTYDIKSKKIKSNWQELRNKVVPDVLHIWGTEKDYYLLAQIIYSDIPSVVYMQGVVNKVAEDYCGNLSLKDKLFNISLQDIYRHTWISAVQKRFKKSALMETQILNKAKGVILENDWCEDQIKALSPHCKIYRSKLPIKKDFFSEDWNFETIVPFTILTNAGTAPLKGHHILFKALSYVIRDFPETVVYIPGFSRMTNSFKDKLGRNGYSNYLRSLIKKYKLENNIKYIGILTSEELAEKISHINAFVMPSSVENHSSSLIEAMVVGAPCVSSYVGGVSSIAKHNENCLLYNFPDAQFLAGCICRIFRDSSLAIKLSYNAKKIRMERNVDILQDFLMCYHDIMK